MRPGVGTLSFLRGSAVEDDPPGASAEQLGSFGHVVGVRVPVPLQGDVCGRYRHAVRPAPGYCGLAVYVSDADSARERRVERGEGLRQREAEQGDLRLHSQQAGSR